MTRDSCKEEETKRKWQQPLHFMTNWNSTNWKKGYDTSFDTKMQTKCTTYSSPLIQKNSWHTEPRAFLILDSKFNSVKDILCCSHNWSRQIDTVCRAVIICCESARYPRLPFLISGTLCKCESQNFYYDWWLLYCQHYVS